MSAVSPAPVRLALTRREAAIALSVSPNFFDQLERAGKLKAVVLSDRKKVYPIAELERFLKKELNRERFAGKVDA